MHEASQLPLDFGAAVFGVEDVDEEPWSPTVEIRPSTRRRKTVGAHWEGDAIVVVVPHRLSKRVQQEYADSLVVQLLEARRATHPTDADLTARAADLLGRYLPGVAPPAAINWTERAGSRWGSCSLTDRTIRLSATLQRVPPWVLDAVLVHELAHLLHPHHDAAFHAVVGRYERADDAELFLAGYQLGLDQQERPG